MQARNARIGMILFCVYLLFYGGFVGVNAFAPEMMESLPFAGINLAILYGFGLIILALVLALLYGALCKAEVEPPTMAEAKADAESKEAGE